MNLKSPSVKIDDHAGGIFLGLGGKVDFDLGEDTLHFFMCSPECGRRAEGPYLTESVEDEKGGGVPSYLGTATQKQREDEKKKG